MPFLAAGALVGGLAAGTGAAAGVGMTALTGAALGASVGGMVQGYSDQRKATNAASDAAARAAQASQVDIQRLDELTRTMAERNARESAALEAELTPEVPELRTQSNLAVLAGLQSDPRQEGAVDALYTRLGGGLRTPLLQAAIERARNDLALGGRLDRETMNATSRAAGAKAGMSFGGLGLGRDVAARDLGLTSMQVAQQRLQNASQLGALELNRESFDATNFLNTFNTLQNYNNAKRSYALGAAQYGQSIPQPIVGLDPSSAANVAVGNANNAGAAYANQANIQANRASGAQQFMGQALGLGLAALPALNAATTAIPQTQLAAPSSLATPINTSITPNFSYFTG